jgi:hypothetical protein
MKTLILFLLVAISPFAMAQRIHVGLYAGSANYSGELNEKLFSCDLSHPVFGITGNYELSERIMIRAGFSKGSLEGADRFSKDSFSRSRNLSFKTQLTEFSLLAEANLLSLYEHRYTPYVFAGLAMFHFDPYTFDRNDNKVYLRPLSTEGQGMQGYNRKYYSKNQLALPFGGGIKIALTDNLRLGVEVGLRKLFTDYLDDVSTIYISQEDLLRERGPQAVDLAFRGDEVDPTAIFPQKGSQRGGSKNKDWYYFGGLHLSYRIGGESEHGVKAGKKSRFGCPSNVQRFY